MPDIIDFHSINTSDPQVHHNNIRCHLGNNVQPENLRPGTGGYPLCKVCAQLNQEYEPASILGEPIPY
jgi:hypothetical protein